MKKFAALACLALPMFFTAEISAQKVEVYSRPRRAERSRDYDALHYRIALRFDEAQKTFWGENTITLAPLAEDFSTCVLDAELLKVTSVVDAQARPLSYTQTDSSVSIALGRTYRYGDTLSLTVAYSSVNPQPDPKRYGMSPDYDLGLDFKDETPENPRLLNTLSFPEGARHWFPCNDQPNDKATNELIVTVRREYSAISNGRLLNVKEDQANATRTFHWTQELPHSTYLFVLAAGPYVMLKDSLGALPINYWVYPSAVQDALRSFQRTPEIIAFFNREYGYDYPWVKYDQITIPGIGGGAESTSATVVGQNTIHDERAEQDFPSHWLVAHEAAHQWWGDLVTMRTWSHTWINESFATYGEYLYSKHLYGEEEGALNLEDKKNAYLREARERYQRPIVFDRYVFPNENFDSHTYPKGAALLHTLRWLMGDAPFQRALSHFLHKHAFQAVDTFELMTAIKEATGQNMDWFFEQWIFKAGHPIFEVSYTWDESAKQLQLNVLQTQQASDWIPIFKTPVQIGVTTLEGKTIHKLWLDKKEERFELECATKPLLVRFDEGNFLLKELAFKKSAEELLYQLMHDDVVGRMWAANELKGFADRAKVIAALRASAQTDSFWAVRRSAVEALGSLQRAEHAAFLKKKCADPKSRVRVAALKALGELKQRALVKFFEERFAREDSYLAQAEALRAIGKCGDKSVLPFLERAGKMKSPRDVIRNAAEAARREIAGR
ncbi:MAG: M1 family aminopeptidase [candidate division KSB1 bacterium]